MTDSSVLSKIEYYTVLKLAAGYAVNESTKIAILSHLPADNIGEAEVLLNQTAEAFEIMFERLVSLVDYFDPIDTVLEKSRVGSTLTPAELLRAARLIRVADNAKSKFGSLYDFGYKALSVFVNNITSLNALGEEISRVVMNGGEISDNASPALKKIRRDISDAKTSIRTKLNAYIRSGAQYLQDAIITIRNERFVLPVKAEHRGEVSGLLHDRSSSGATVFIEPMPIVELNNKLVELTISEQQEIERILSALTAQVSAAAGELAINQESIIGLDAVFARAAYCERLRAIRPELRDDMSFRIVNGRHPLIAVDKVVPISIMLGGKENTLVISGPNTGGKTVSLKTAGLFSAMAAAGFFLPASEGTQVAVFESLHCDIGDNQSIEQSLSTYSSHMKNIIGILDNLRPNSLVLIDELGAGTDPQEGAALAIAIVQHLASRRVLSIITTHYTELKDFSMEHPSIRNASMEFDPNTLLPTYRVLMDIPGTSNAIAIAAHLGLPADIVQAAGDILSSERHSVENILRLAHSLKSQAEADKALAESERQAIESERLQIAGVKERLSDELERLKSRSDKEVKRIIGDKVDYANELIAKIEELTVSAELAGGELLKAKQLRTRLESKRRSLEGGLNVLAQEPIPIAEIRQGMRVVIAALNKTGVVRSLPDRKKNVLIESDGITLSVSAESLVRAQGNSGNTHAEAKTSTVSIQRSQNKVVTEINLLGKNVPEAVAELETAIDSCLINLTPELKVIHGKGTGALRNAVQGYLKGVRSVSEFGHGSLAEGGAGVTIVKF